MVRKPVKVYIARGDLPSPLLCMTTTGGGVGVSGLGEGDADLEVNSLPRD